MLNLSNSSKASLESTWKAVEQLKKKGLAKSVGISNYTGALLLDLFTYAEITPAVLQIEHHPYFTQENLVKLAKERGIAITAYSSFGPASFIECDMKVASDTKPLLQHDLVTGIAEKHGKTAAQVLLRWATQRGLAVIPKSNDPKRLAQNLDVVNFELGEDEIQKISDLNINLKFNVPTNVSFTLFLCDVWISLTVTSTVFLATSSPRWSSLCFTNESPLEVYVQGTTELAQRFLARHKYTICIMSI